MVRRRMAQRAQRVVKAPFIFIFFMAISAYAADRTDIILTPNTTLNLLQILPAKYVIKKSDGMPKIHLNLLYLSEGATVYLDQEVMLDAKRVVLRTGSQLHTMGHSLILKTDELISGETKGRMGFISTQHVFHHNGKTGDKGNPGLSFTYALAAKSFVPGRMEPEKICGDSTVGKRGKRGKNGKHAGSLTLKVKHFRGCYIDASGGNGGTGGPGGRGGDGGKGYTELTHKGIYDNLLSTRPHLFVGLNGGNASDGGPGGRGGDSGQGGSIVIQYDTRSENYKDALFLYYHGGEPGKEGSGGRPGRSGNAGSIYLGPAQRGNYKLVTGRPGRAADPGERGPRGKRGNDGAHPRFEQVAYEVGD